MYLIDNSLSMAHQTMLSPKSKKVKKILSVKKGYNFKKKLPAFYKSYKKQLEKVTTLPFPFTLGSSSQNPDVNPLPKKLHVETSNFHSRKAAIRRLQPMTNSITSSTTRTLLSHLRSRA